MQAIRLHLFESGPQDGQSRLRKFPLHDRIVSIWSRVNIHSQFPRRRPSFLARCRLAWPGAEPWYAFGRIVTDEIRLLSMTIPTHSGIVYAQAGCRRTSRFSDNLPYWPAVYGADGRPVSWPFYGRTPH